MKKQLFELILKEMQETENFQEIDFIRKYQLNERTVRRYFKILRDKGLIKRIGVGKDRHWIVLKWYFN